MNDTTTQESFGWTILEGRLDIAGDIDAGRVADSELDALRREFAARRAQLDHLHARREQALKMLDAGRWAGRDYVEALIGELSHARDCLRVMDQVEANLTFRHHQLRELHAAIRRYREWLEDPPFKKLEPAAWLKNLFLQVCSQCDAKLPFPKLHWPEDSLVTWHNPNRLTLFELGPRHRLLSYEEYLAHDLDWKESLPGLEVWRVKTRNWVRRCEVSAGRRGLSRRSTYRIPLETPLSTGKEAGRE